MNVYGKIATGFAIAAFLLLPVILWIDITWLWLFILCVVLFHVFSKVSCRADYVDWLSRVGDRKKSGGCK